MKIKEFEDILKKLELNNTNTLIIVDVLGGLKPSFDLNLNDYSSVSTMLDEFESTIDKVTKGYGIIYIHHLNKSDKGELMGSQALGARVSAKIIFELDKHDVKRGLLTIEANDYDSRNIPIKQDSKKHLWVLDAHGCAETPDKEFEFQLLRINETLQKMPEKRLRGTVNEIISKTKMTIPPRILTRWLKNYKKQLRDNNIRFIKTKSNTTIVELYIIDK